MARWGCIAMLGATALTRTPLSATSSAAQRVSAITPAFGGGVVGLAGLRAPAGDRGVVDDRAAAARDHVAQRGAGAAEGAVEGDVEHARPLLVAHLEDRRLAAEAGVVDEHVELAVAVDDAVDQRLDLLLDGDVAADRERPLAGDRLELARRPRSSRRSWTSEIATRAPPARGALGGGPADAGAGGGGDEDRAAGQQRAAGGRLWRCCGQLTSPLARRCAVRRRACWRASSHRVRTLAYRPSAC